MVFQRNMNRLDSSDTAGSFGTVENYIAYMQERLELLGSKTVRQEKEITDLTARVAALEAKSGT